MPILIALLVATGVSTAARLYPSLLPPIDMHGMSDGDIALPTLNAGDTAPDFELFDQVNKATRLGDVARPTLLVFYRGNACPHCVRQLLALKKQSPFLERHHIKTLGISADPPFENLQANIRFGGLPFTLLSDPDHAVAARYGLYRASDDTLLHGLFLIDASGKITWSHAGSAAMEDLTPLLKAIDPASETAGEAGTLPASETK